MEVMKDEDSEVSEGSEDNTNWGKFYPMSKENAEKGKHSKNSENEYFPHMDTKTMRLRRIATE